MCRNASSPGFLTGRRCSIVPPEREPAGARREREPLTPMDKRKREVEWAEATRWCRLNAETLRMTQELGLNPRRLIKNIPSKSRLWKAPVAVWVRELYRKREEGAARRRAAREVRAGRVL